MSRFPITISSDGDPIQIDDVRLECSAGSTCSDDEEPPPAVDVSTHLGSKRSCATAPRVKKKPKRKSL